MSRPRPTHGAFRRPQSPLSWARLGSMSEKLVIVTVAIAIPFGAAAGYVVGDLTNGQDRIGNAIVGVLEHVPPELTR